MFNILKQMNFSAFKSKNIIKIIGFLILNFIIIGSIFILFFIIILFKIIRGFFSSSPSKSTHTRSGTRVRTHTRNGSDVKEHYRRGTTVNRK